MVHKMTQLCGKQYMEMIKYCYIYCSENSWPDIKVLEGTNGNLYYSCILLCSMLLSFIYIYIYDVFSIDQCEHISYTLFSIILTKWKI